MKDDDFVERVYEAISAELGNEVPTSEQIVAAAKAAIKVVTSEASKMCEEQKEKIDVSQYRDGINEGITRCVKTIEFLNPND